MTKEPPTGADSARLLLRIILALVCVLILAAVWSARAEAKPHRDVSRPECSLAPKDMRMLARLERRGLITWRCGVEIAAVPMPRERPAEAGREVVPNAAREGQDVAAPGAEQAPSRATLLASAVPGDVDPPANIFHRYVERSFVPAHDAVRMGCPGDKPLPGRLTSLLETAAAHFRCQVSVVSAYRSPAHNRRVHGARKSQHMACRAVDFVVPCAPKDAVFAWVKRQPGIRGAGIYRSRLIHADVRPAKKLITWDWRKKRTRYARKHHRRTDHAG